MQVERGLSKWNGRVPPLNLSTINVYTQKEQQNQWERMRLTNGKYLNCQQKIGCDGLPIDPREWSRSEVWTWLTNLAISEGIEPTPELALKFPMNGKALCLMSLDMYLVRVPIGGKMMYRDFRVRLAKAMSHQYSLDL